MRRFWCWLAGGHLRVTHYRSGEVYEACWLCNARLSPGWVLDLAPPRRRVVPTLALHIAVESAEFARGLTAADAVLRQFGERLNATGS